MTRPFRFAVLSGLALVTDGLIDLLRMGRRLTKNQEKIMAEFAALRAALEDQKTELVAAVDRVAEDVQALQDRIANLELDSEDQAEVDGLAEQVRASVETLRGIDPVKAVDEVPENPETPAEPVPGEEPTNPA